MFDFIETMPSGEKSKEENTTAPLEGTVYTMPAHRSSPVPAQGKTGWMVTGSIIVGIIIVATLGVVVWFAFQESGTTPAQTPVAETPTTEPTPETPTTPSTPETPPVTETPPTPPTPTTPPPLDYVRSPDSDGDDLTDVEERLFSSDALKPDTDGDSFVDGAEVKFLYDPTRPNPAKLETSSSATTYSNPNFSYAILYPSQWVVDAVDKENKEVIFSSATGEFVSLTVQDNPEKLSALEWYTTVRQPNADTATLQTMSYDTWSGVMTPDGLEVYMTAKDDQGAVITPYVYVLKYDLGDTKEMNFGAVFQMMIRSFLVTELSFQR